MPCRLGGLCSGASVQASSMAASTSSSMTPAVLKRLPPCTTRWPTHWMSEGSVTTAVRPSVSILITHCSASACVLNSASTTVSTKSVLYLAAPRSWPMRSTMPLATSRLVVRDSTRKKPYLRLLLPALSTSTCTAAGPPSGASDGRPLRERKMLFIVVGGGAQVGAGRYCWVVGSRISSAGGAGCCRSTGDVPRRRRRTGCKVVRRRPYRNGCCWLLLCRRGRSYRNWHRARQVRRGSRDAGMTTVWNDWFILPSVGQLIEYGM
mmetsp:Transcript_2840/g.7526  ORF Transcript_2840/g.7526 Transcript_2840/m.7526 type:complete len:264 (-) Transcript_2840:4-795(-)